MEYATARPVTGSAPYDRGTASGMTDEGLGNQRLSNRSAWRPGLAIRH